MDTMTHTTTTHRVKTLFQVPSGSPNRYPTHAGWECTCGATGTVKAPWGSQTDASLAAHREHAGSAAAAPLMIEPEPEGQPCDECGADAGQECQWACTSRPDTPSDAPLNVRATVRRPDGDTFVIFGGQVPAWLWDDPHTRELWKRVNRSSVLANAHIDPKARGFRVTWDAWDPEEAPLV